MGSEVPVSSAGIPPVIVSDVLSGRLYVGDDVSEELPLVRQRGPEIVPIEEHAGRLLQDHRDVEYLLVAGGLVSVRPRGNVCLTETSWTGHSAGWPTRVVQLFNEAHAQSGIEMERHLFVDGHVLAGPQFLKVLILLDH